MIASSVVRSFAGGIVVERVLLGLDRAADAGVGPAAEALGDEAAGAGLAGAFEQVGGALGPQPIGLREGSLEAAHVEVAGQRGHLMHDHLGPGGGDRGDDRVAVEPVGEDGLGARGAQGLLVVGAAAHRGDLVAAADQHRDEAAAERPGRAGDEDPHDATCSREC